MNSFYCVPRFSATVGFPAPESWEAKLNSDGQSVAHRAKLFLPFPLQAYPSGRDHCPQALKAGVSLGPPITPYPCAPEKNGTNKPQERYLGAGLERKNGVAEGSPRP